jgi:ribonuclease HI
MNRDVDIITFDGSCTPNPGGQIRVGAIMTIAGQTHQAEEAFPAATGNTVNTAEYCGLLLGLRTYFDAGGNGPVLVRGDSQLIIRQMTGEYTARDALAVLQQEAWSLIDQNEVTSISFEWIPREQNTAADLLTQAPQHRLPSPSERVVLENSESAPVSAALRQQISRLNNHPSPGFGDFAHLRVGGRDRFSQQNLAALQRSVRDAGAGGVAALGQVEAATTDPRAQAAMLRWCLRGLAVELSVRKQQVDAEIAANARPRRTTVS